ncbi:pentapeptide repeat-containing protein [Kineobactrum sediminis]
MTARSFFTGLTSYYLRQAILRQAILRQAILRQAILRQATRCCGVDCDCV